MNNSGKWLDVDDADAPASIAARAAIKSRLCHVRSLLEQTAARSRASAEDIHQLRVATRRAVAALDAFANFIPKRRAKRLRRRLNKLRDAASVIRDLDIVSESSRGSHCFGSTTAEEKVPRQLHRLISQRRKLAQKSLTRFTRSKDQRKLRRLAKGITKRVRWRGPGEEPSFAEAAGDSLSLASSVFFDAAAARLWDAGSLHRMRIRAKRLRYSLELLGGAFEPDAVNQVYAEITLIQQQLGDINDRAMTRATYKYWLTEPGELPQTIDAAADNEQVENALAEYVRGLMALQESRLVGLVGTFRECWTDQRQEELRKQLDRLQPTTGESSSTP